jgi:hypothetical protein
MKVQTNVKAGQVVIVGDTSQSNSNEVTQSNIIAGATIVGNVSQSNSNTTTQSNSIA